MEESRGTAILQPMPRRKRPGEDPPLTAHDTSLACKLRGEPQPWGAMVPDGMPSRKALQLHCSRSPGLTYRAAAAESNRVSPRQLDS